MDESPSEAMNFYKGIAVKEEETDSSAAELLCKLINEEKSRENSSGLEAVPWQKKVKNPDSGHGVFVLHLDLKKYSKTCETPVFSRTHLFQETTSPAEERDLHYTLLPSPMQFIRRNARQEEIAFDRECKKLEIAWTNRGLPVDRESLCSAASKDAFDLRGLSESLPSTSASEKKPSVIEFRRILHQSPRSYSSQMIQNIERFETLRNRSVPSYTPRERRLFMDERLPAPETIPAVCNSLKESAIKHAMLRRSLVRAQRWSRWKRIYSQVPPSELEKESASEERRNLDVGKAFQYLARLNSEFAEMSPDDKQEEKREEKQNIDDENNQQSIGLAPLPKLHQDMGQCSSWEPGRNWITDFRIRDVHVPLNSPNKKEVNTDKNDPFLSMGKALAEFRQSSMRLMRAQSKLRTLNSLRGDMDESESEKPSLKQAFRASIHNLLDSRKEADDLWCSRQLEKGKRIRDMKESFKSFRSFQSHFLLGSVKSDKVVPDKVVPD